MTFRHHHSTKRQSIAGTHSQRGGILIEGLVSLLLLSVAALGLVGMQTLAIRVDNDAQYRHTATLVMADLANEMLLTHTEIKDTDEGPWSARLEQLPNAELEIEDAPEADRLNNSWVKDITITWMPPNKTGNERESLTTRITFPK